MKIVQYDRTGDVSLAILKPGENPQMVQKGCFFNETVNSLTLYIKVTDFFENTPYYSLIPVRDLPAFIEALQEESASI